MRCCLIALNHHIVSHYEFLFVRNKIANIKKVWWESFHLLTFEDLTGFTMFH